MRKSWIRIGSVVGMSGIIVFGAIGCASDGATGGLLGAGVGALAGQAIGGDTEATLIGTAVGAGVGYVAGNESDKAKMRRRSEYYDY